MGLLDPEELLRQECRLVGLLDPEGLLRRKCRPKIFLLQSVIKRNGVILFSIQPSCVPLRKLLERPYPTPAHQTDKVVELVQSVDAMVHFIPPSSQDLNPIEEGVQHYSQTVYSVDVLLNNL